MCIIHKKQKYLLIILAVTLTIIIMAAGVVASNNVSFNEAIAKSDTVDGGDNLTGSNTLATNHSLAEKIVTSQANNSANNYVYSDNSEEESPSANVYNDEPEPDHTTYDEINVTMEGEKTTGSVDVPEGSIISIKEKPANGTVTVDEDGSWSYKPLTGFFGEDQFILVIDHEDDSQEIITVKVLVEDVSAQPDDNDEQALPSSGGFTISAILALWFFIGASYCLKAGVLKRSL